MSYIIGQSSESGMPFLEGNLGVFSRALRMFLLFDPPNNWTKTFLQSVH